MEFVEAPPFTRHLAGYLKEDAYREFQASLSAIPEAGDLIPGGEQQIWLMAIYGKDEASELTVQQKKALKAAIENESAARAAKRGIRG